jgi:hypothetical protein
MSATSAPAPAGQAAQIAQIGDPQLIGPLRGEVPLDQITRRWASGSALVVSDAVVLGSHLGVVDGSVCGGLGSGCGREEMLPGRPGFDLEGGRIV